MGALSRTSLLVQKPRTSTRNRGQTPKASNYRVRPLNPQRRTLSNSSWRPWIVRNLDGRSERKVYSNVEVSFICCGH